jgi:hypothetical protein
MGSQHMMLNYSTPHVPQYHQLHCVQMAWSQLRTDSWHVVVGCVLADAPELRMLACLSVQGKTIATSSVCSVSAGNATLVVHNAHVSEHVYV